MPCIDPKVGERLAEYAAHLLHGEERQQFEDHLLSCDVCAEEFGTMALTLESMEALPQAWVVEELLSTGQELLRQASWEEAVGTFQTLLRIAPEHPEAQEGLRQAEQRGREGTRESLDATAAQPLESDAGTASRGFRDRFVRGLSPLWHPFLAGQMATATAISEQEHVFHLDEGDIRLTCDWRASYQDQPATLRVAWQANLTRPTDLWVRFTPPNNPTALLTEVRLGEALEGEAVFTEYTLDFDPARHPWALTIVLKEPQG